MDKFQQIKLYFNADKICLGGVDNNWWLKDFDGDYWGSDYFWLPVGYNPIGKPGSELLQFINKPPATVLDGRRILKSHPLPAQSATVPGEITLREWRKDAEWATHLHNLQDGGYYGGRFFTDRAAAESDFNERVKQELNTPRQHGELDAIEVPESVLRGIEAVRSLAAVDMFDAQIVQAQAVALEYLETALWIEANTNTYYYGMRRGFTTPK